VVQHLRQLGVVAGGLDLLGRGVRVGDWSRPGGDMLAGSRPGGDMLLVSRPGGDMLAGSRPGGDMLLVSRPGGLAVGTRHEGQPNGRIESGSS
jgi:hypothetical protein